METRSTPHSSFRSFAKEIHVLLVDNDKQLLAFIARILEWFSYKVTPVESGLDAISIILDPWKKVDIVLAETRLPDIDGFLLLNETTTRGIPTVLMSADEDVRVAKLALHHGAYFFLAKPPSVDVLKSLWQCVMTENINKAKKIQEKENKNNISTSPIKTERNKNETNCTKSKDGISKNRAAGHGKIYTKWSEELHGKFMAAVHQLGEGKCYPNEILELMNEPHLTRMQIASHLQKCRHGNWHGPKPRKPIIPECLNNAGGSRKFGSMPQLEKSSNSTQTPPDQENHTDPGKYPLVENSFLPNKAGNEGCTTLFGMYPSQNSGLLSSNFSSTATTGGMINSSNQSPLPSDFFNLPPEMRDSLSFSKLLGGPSRRNYCSIQENRQFEDEPIFFNQHQGPEKPNKGKDKAQS